MLATAYVTTAQSVTALSVLVLYSLACAGLSMIPILFRTKMKNLYIVNCLIALPVFDKFHRMAHLPSDDWEAGLLIVTLLAGLMSTYVCAMVRETYVRRDDCIRYLRDLGYDVTYDDESGEKGEQDL